MFSCPVMSDSLWSHGHQHARTPCPSSSPGVCPSSCSLHWWCCPSISSSDALFFFCTQSFPESGTFPMSLLFVSHDQNTGASASAWVLPVNIQGWSPLRVTGLISLLSKGLWGVFFSTTLRKHKFFGILPSFYLNDFSLGDWKILETRSSIADFHLWTKFLRLVDRIKNMEIQSM